MEIIKGSKDERAKILAKYIIENKSTVREAAKRFNVSKTTVHNDITERLEKVSPSLAFKAKQILEINKEQRHMRGGLATKLKYQKMELKESEVE